MLLAEPAARRALFCRRAAVSVWTLRLTATSTITLFTPPRIARRADDRSVQAVESTRPRGPPAGPRTGRGSQRPLYGAGLSPRTRAACGSLSGAFDSKAGAGAFAFFDSAAARGGI